MQNKSQSASVDAIKSSKQVKLKPFQKKFERTDEQQKQSPHQNKKPCHRCTSRQNHSLQQCRAKDAVCHLCSLKRHYQSQYRTKRVQTVGIESDSSDKEIVIMKVTKANPRRENPVKWLREVQVANTEIIKFKTNTGAVVTCLPEEIYLKSKVSLGPIKISKKKLFGADQKCLSVERSTY